MTPGRRNDEWFTNSVEHPCRAGDYMKDPRDGHWYAIPPTATGHLYPASIAAHEVEEHEDGTITVSPSLLITEPPNWRYHGYLRRGEWTEDMG